MPKWLKDARSEIIGGLVVALIVGLCSMLPFGGANHEAEHSQEDSRSVIELRNQLEALKAEIHRRDEDLRQSDTRQQEDSQRVTDLRSQVEALKQELQRKDEALKQAEAQKQEASRNVTELRSQVDTLQQELQREKSKKKRLAMIDSEFIELCKSGNTEKVKEAIIDGANVNAKGNHGYTALMWAAWRGHTQIAELLIKYGAEVNAKTTGGNTALILAGKNTETAYILRSHGAKE